ELHGLLQMKLKLPPEIGVNLPNLEGIYMAQNYLYGLIPNLLRNASRIQALDLSANGFQASTVSLLQLTSTIRYPRGIENYRNLMVLSLHSNSFHSIIHSSLEILTKLERLSLNQNMFFGDIPEKFGNLSKLYEIIAEYNQFSAKIPKSIMFCKRLAILDLVGNRLDGNIPKEIFELSDLRASWTSANKAEGRARKSTSASIIQS
ncbi:hypothetical protein GIB67_039378, partial [Kingdonia uniflora]